MNDQQIIDLYFKRDEQAIAKTKEVYGAFCSRIAKNILNDPEDAEECVSDALFKVWNEITPLVPESLKAYLGKTVRNCALSRYRAEHAKKRDRNLSVYLEELDDCIPAGGSVEEQVESAELSRHINEWLESLDKQDAMLFVRRYWYGDSVQELAGKCGISPGKMAQKMHNLRKKLKKHLENRD